MSIEGFIMGNSTFVGTDSGVSGPNEDGGNTAFGHRTLYETYEGNYNTAVGCEALTNNYDGKSNTAVGYQALTNNYDGDYNVAVGYKCLENNSSGNWNTAIGNRTLYKNTTGINNIGIGYLALVNNEEGRENIALGRSALSSNKHDYNIAIGTQALLTNTGNHNTAVGHRALLTTRYNNCSGIGYNSSVKGDNQIQLGNSDTTTYAYGSVQNRSDKRDKTDIQDTKLGLDFIMGLKPVEFRWDYREDYIEETTNEDGYTDLKEIPKDGSKKRKRLHQGFIAQEVKALMDSLGVDFAGYQDHKVKGGEDVLTLGYTEFIPPLVKAIHEQQNTILKLQKKVEMLQNK
ncbi:tail fiber domain-containing protein [Vallitalea maricola]|uniref:Uncharacterized protein n=1 Tax=Vallitalea maricola TaxID=3074433 RepID=A0ACB5UIA7_9FIRM|nr:hypothetical protein AN2V17_19290 [Vallitalea sp. AN17-2]